MLWSRRIFIDVYFATFLALALMALVLARAHWADTRRRRYLLLMYVALGLAMLTKGPAALVLPGLVLLVYLAWTRRLGDLGSLMLPAGVLIVAVIVAPWYVLDYQQHGWEHIKGFFIGENVGRYTETVGVQHRPSWFYLPVVLSDLTPFALLFPAALIAAWRARSSEWRLLIAWALVFVGVFSLSSTKQDLYIYPIVPAVAVIIAAMPVLWGGADAAMIRRLARIGAGFSGCVLMIAGGFLFWITSVSHTVPGIAAGGVVGAAMMLGGAVALALTVRRDLRPTVVVLAATAVATNWLIVCGVMRPFEEYKPVAPMSEWLRQHANGAIVAHYKTPLPSMTYYLGRSVTTVFDLESMTRLVAEQRAMYVVLRPGDYDDLRTATTERLCVIDRRPLPVFDAKVSEMLSGKLPQIWLAGVKGACQ
jgi:4-amino-4-deoxy-L-arabinose transferase-like glycosyltransferase